MSTQVPLVDPNDPSWRRPAVTRSQLRTDAVLAVVLFVGTLFSLMLYRVAGLYDKPAEMWVCLIWAVLITLPLALRRRFPNTVAIVVSGAFIGGGELQVPELLMCNITLFMALYAVGAWVDNRRTALVVRAVIIAAMLGWLVIAMLRTTTDPDALDGFSRVGAFSPLVAYLMIQILTNLLYFGGAYYFGDRSYASAKQKALLEYRTAELERERERTEQQAVALERVRIARELHDVVAHHVSVMGVQAGAARTVLESNPAMARDALANVELGARTAIDELHKLLHTLRESEPADGRASTSASTLGLESLSALVRDSTASGLPTTLDVIGERLDVPGLVQFSLYRIAQEALTNARKHAGPTATADVRVRYLPDSVELEVGNTGNVPSRPQPGGLGLIGMRERIDAIGGTLETGPRARGGYLVRARVPVPGKRTGERTGVPADAASPDGADNTHVPAAHDDAQRNAQHNARETTR
ncbi:histidine kinase [Mycetocola zhujimingii]|uniref:histidine kinase n=1 Tax=Mycetocola zhujimingii TaxID=2079792 RepID=UPI000D3A2782|nr:histidine kinase [Mycetocola zhujimingii]AWB87439.1 two-component sensor histidine kinase [Mycetocola zhujimingii]